MDDLLEISRITHRKIEIRPEPMSVGSAVHAAVETVAPLIEQRAQRIEVDVPPAPLRLEADPARIAQVPENLLTNASKYTPAGGSIRVEVEPHLDAVDIRVVDDGVGIEPAKLADLFQVFHQLDATLGRAQGGLGIGLALVKRLVELHGGSVSVTSRELGKGSTFTVRLPLQAPERTSDSKRRSRPLQVVEADEGAAGGARYAGEVGVALGPWPRARRPVARIRVARARAARPSRSPAPPARCRSG